MIRRSQSLLTLSLCGLLFTFYGCNGDSTDDAGATAGTGTSGGSSDGGGGGDAEPGSRGVIGCSLLTGKNPFFITIGEHITSEGAKHGYETTVQFAEEDPTIQANQVRDFIANEVAAIVISPCETKAIVPVVQEANEAGIPVFTVDIPCYEEGAEFVCQVATDNESGGRQAAEAMIEALGAAGGDVAILHYAQAESCRLRVKGFTDVINEHNETSSADVTIVSTLEGGGDRLLGTNATQDLLQGQPELKGIFCINDPSALGAVAALEGAGRTDIIVIGFDGQREAKEAIRDGRIYADPIQYPDQMGIKIVEQIVAYSRGDEVDAEILIPTTLYTQEIAQADESLNEE
jgi:ribose transport system substrate-binding protein